MAWDFETEPEFQRELDWMDAFVRDEVEPLDFVLGDPYDKTDTKALAIAKPLKERVKDIPPRPAFLIQAKGESLNGVYFRSAGEPANWRLWEVPGADHIGGIDARPAQYERRVTAFFDRPLLKRE